MAIAPKNKSRFSAGFLLAIFCTTIAGILSASAGLAGSASANPIPQTPGADSAPQGLEGDIEDRDATQNQQLAGRLRNIGLSLSQIKYQAIQIFLEVTRQPLTLNDKLVFKTPTSISEKGLKQEDQYEPPRKAWLFYFVGSLEPIIELYQHNLKAASAGTAKHPLPPSIHEALTPIREDWTACVNRMNDHLNHIYALAGENATNNLAIAKEAVGIFNDAQCADKARQKAVTMLRERLKRKS